MDLLALLGHQLSRSVVCLLLIGADIGAYFLTYMAVAPFLLGRPERAMEVGVFGLAAVAAIALNAANSLYPGYQLYDFEHLRRRVISSVKAILLAVLGALLVLGSWPSPALVLAFVAATLVVQPILHCFARRICWQLGLWGDRATIIAPVDVAARLAAHFRRQWHYGIRPEAPLRNQQEASPFGSRRIALLVGESIPHAEQLAALRQSFAEVILLADTPNLKLGGLRPVDIHGQIGLRIAMGEQKSASEMGRRLLDLVVALPAAAIALPIVALAGAAIYAIDPGPIFFWQTREGLAGKPVRVLKLRTMYKDAEQRLEALFLVDPALKAEWLAHFKLKRDPRILPIVGKVLRSTSCDELPQLFNVVVGDMGVVGPRPFPDYHLSAMDAEFREKRRSVVPGLTGLWQISERSNADLEQQRQIDEFYIDNRSFWLDLQILARTIPAVLRRGGAY